MGVVLKSKKKEEEEEEEWHLGIWEYRSSSPTGYGERKRAGPGKPQL